MDRKNELAFIASNTNTFLQASGKTLEKRLEEIALTDQEENEIVKDRTIKTIRDKGLSLFGTVGDVISTFLNWNDDVNDDLSEAKKMVLLEQYFNKSDSHEKAISMLKDFLTNPQGNTLFNKILRILDDSPPDEELMQHLSSVLKVIIDSGMFEELFDQHKYALSQIERLTPQALSIIADYKQWPAIRLGHSISFGPKVTSDWFSEFTNEYCAKKGIRDQDKYKRVQHSVIELQRQGLMEALKGQDGLTHCELTHVGTDLLPYIS
ncbi:hypothetical protein [Neobacillus drentensis]|uniref:hypothetical protein n=1 Tax=Neobacillus drentensis TaxID=220684 RepID=UPI003000D37A